MYDYKFIFFSHFILHILHMIIEQLFDSHRFLDFNKFTHFLQVDVKVIK